MKLGVVRLLRHLLKRDADGGSWLVTTKNATAYGQCCDRCPSNVFVLLHLAVCFVQISRTVLRVLGKILFLESTYA